MKRTVKLLALMLFVAIVFTGCGLKNKDAIVKVNNHVITQGDYDELFKQTVKNPALQMLKPWK